MISKGHISLLLSLGNKRSTKYISQRLRYSTRASHDSTRKTMLAVEQIGYGSPWEALKPNTVAIPEPKGNEVLIQIEAASVNPIDTWMRRGYGKQLFETIRKPPYVPGRDCAGTIVEIGPSVWNHKVGDVVYAAINPTDIHGCYAEYATVNEHYIAKKPKKLSFRDAASIPYIALTAWEAIVQVAKVKRGQHVLVLGASGGIGNFAVQLLKYYGATVYATSSPEYMDLVQSLGADYVFDYTKKEIDEVDMKYDVIVDLVGGEERIASFSKLAKGGHLVSTVGDLIRLTDQRGIIPGFASAYAELGSEKLVQGTALGVKYDWIYFKPNSKALSKVAELIDDGAIKPVVDPKEFSLLETPLAHEYYEEKKNKGKVVIDVKRRS